MSTFLDFNLMTDDDAMVLPFDASKCNASENAVSNEQFLESLGRALDNIVEAAGPWLNSGLFLALIMDGLLEAWVNFWVKMDAIIYD